MSSHEGCTCGRDHSQPGLAAWFTDGHRACDDLWSEVERLAESGQQAELERAVARFCAATRGHLDVEEQLLFPRVEAATGMHGHGPTEIMRSEHRQMRGLLDQVEVAARAGNSDEVLNLGDTLLMFTQQHNSKEEQVLYPLSARVLSQQWPEMRSSLRGRVSDP